MARILLLLCFALSSCSFLDLDRASSESPREIASMDRISSQESSKNALRKRILVLPFRNDSSVGGPELSQFAAEEVRNQLSNVNEFIVVREQDVPGASLLNSPANEADLVPLMEAARAHGLVALVLGNLKEVKIKERGNQVGLFQTRYNTVQAIIEVKLLDVITQKYTAMKDLSAEITQENTRFFGSRSIASTDAVKAEGAVTKAIEQMVPTFSSEAHRIGWSGRIAKIDVHRFYINAGELSGVTRNQLLRVFGDAEPVVDKESGLVIGMAPGRFKGLLKVVDFFGEDGAIAIVHSGAGFQERDRVEAYVAPAP
ncbi:MAG: hypothetical protein ACKN9V_06085 [Pseudomonadota bacterium]